MFLQFGNEAQQLEWAKRESERAERERLKRLRQQEQEDLELAIALSKAEMSNALPETTTGHQGSRTVTEHPAM